MISNESGRCNHVGCGSAGLSTVASVSRITFQHFELLDQGALELRPGRLGAIEALPVLYFSDGRMWEEGSLYLASWARAIAEDELGGDLQSVQSSAWQLRAYLDFCEEKSLDLLRRAEN